MIRHAPENGAREFGFEYLDDGVKFYTRGVTRPNALVRVFGAVPQRIGWTSMMKGISAAMRGRGGAPKEDSVKMIKFTRD